MPPCTSSFAHVAVWECMRTPAHTVYRREGVSCRRSDGRSNASGLKSYVSMGNISIWTEQELMW